MQIAHGPSACLFILVPRLLAGSSESRRRRACKCKIRLWCAQRSLRTRARRAPFLGSRSTGSLGALLEKRAPATEHTRLGTDAPGALGTCAAHGGLGPRTAGAASTVLSPCVAPDVEPHTQNRTMRRCKVKFQKTAVNISNNAQTSHPDSPTSTSPPPPQQACTHATQAQTKPTAHHHPSHTIVV
jgi:hypothetical protein